MDNLNLRGKPDRIRINVNEPWERQFWADQLRVTQAQLIDAVRRVGPMADDVRRYLVR